MSFLTLRYQLNAYFHNSPVYFFAHAITFSQPRYAVESGTFSVVSC